MFSCVPLEHTYLLLSSCKNFHTFSGPLLATFSWSFLSKLKLVFTLLASPSFFFFVCHFCFANYPPEMNYNATVWNSLSLCHKNNWSNYRQFVTAYQLLRATDGTGMSAESIPLAHAIFSTYICLRDETSSYQRKGDISTMRSAQVLTWVADFVIHLLLILLMLLIWEMECNQM